MDEKKRGVFIVDESGKIVFYLGELHEIAGLNFDPYKIIGESLLMIFNYEVVNKLSIRSKSGFFDFKDNHYNFRRRIIKTPKEESLVYLEIEAESDESISFYSMLIHEIKNPLTAVKSLVQSLSQFILEDFKTDNLEQIKDVEDYFTRITAEIDRLNRLLTSVKYIAKHLQSLYVSFDLVKVANNTIKIFETTFKQKNIQLITSFPDENLIFYGDPDQFQQMFNNLISNAIEAISEPNGKIRFSININGDRAIFITVEDEGAGIDKNDLDRIFKAFYTKKLGGMGIGLTVVKMIVKRYKGTLNIESVVNKGTKLSIMIPPFDRNRNI